MSLPKEAGGRGRGPEGPEAEAGRVGGGGGSEGASRGPAGVQIWDRFLVHHYAGRTGRGPRNFPSKLPPWGVHGHISFGRFALGFSVQDPNGPSAGWAGWLGWAGLAGLKVHYITIYL